MTSDESSLRMENDLVALEAQAMRAELEVMAERVARLEKQRKGEVALAKAEHRRLKQAEIDITRVVGMIRPRWLARRSGAFRKLEDRWGSNP